MQLVQAHVQRAASVLIGMPSWCSFCALRPLITLIGGRSDHSDLSLSTLSPYSAVSLLMITSLVTKKDHHSWGWAGVSGQVTFEGDLGRVGGWSGQRLPR